VESFVLPTHTDPTSTSSNAADVVSWLEGVLDGHPSDLRRFQEFN
jgi:hypothetical protein